MNIVADKKIQFIDLQAQQDLIREKINERINRVLDHGKYIMGPEVQELEEVLTNYVGAKYCVSCASGTDALLMALMAYDVGAGDVIFTTPFTFIATAEVISLLGATPVFVDIDPGTFNIDPAKLRETILNRINNNGHTKPRGIIAVDLFGQPADYNEINKIAAEFDLFVIEDAAQSFGAEYQGNNACGLADVGTTSFFPAKPLGCYGDGGAIFTDNKEIANLLTSIRIHGKGLHKYENARIGINGRLDTMQAAILLAKLEIFDNEIKLRNEVAKRYSELLPRSLKTPIVKPDRLSAWAQYSILADDRDKIMAKLKINNIPTAIYYPKPLHLQDAFSDLGFKAGDFPVSEEVVSRIFSLPMHPYLEKGQQEFIAESITALF